MNMKIECQKMKTGYKEEELKRLEWIIYSNEYENNIHCQKMYDF